MVLMTKTPNKLNPANTAKPTPAVIASTFGDTEAVYGGEPVPAGQYNLRISEPEVRLAEKTGDPWVLAWSVVTDGKFVGRKIKTTFFFNTTKPDGTPAQSLGMSKALLQTILGGVPATISAISAKDSLKLANAVADAIDGHEYTAKVTVSNGKQKDGTEDPYGPQNRIQATKPATK